MPMTSSELVIQALIKRVEESEKNLAHLREEVGQRLIDIGQDLERRITRVEQDLHAAALIRGELNERVTKVESDHKHLGQGWNEVDDRQNQLEEKLTFLQQQFTTMQMAMKEIMGRNMCEHEPICLPSSKGPIPILHTEIADARKLDIIAPGQQPPIAFAIAMCKKCGAPYVFINTLEEAQPFEGGAAPVPMVKPGEPV